MPSVKNYQVSEEIMNLLRQEKNLIPIENITLEKEIGQGAFSSVYKGILIYPEKKKKLEVTLKTLKSYMSVESFINEGLIMKDFDHKNVMSLIGVSFKEDGLPIIVLPFMANGDLHSYIKDKKNNTEFKRLMEFAIDIAKGMEYLSSLKFVHRDLAARNCMLDKHLWVKIADFGLSRDIYESDCYNSGFKKGKLPFRWMAPESLEKDIYSTKSDVWSYGVLVWELLAEGVIPYPYVGNFDILKFLKDGQRLVKPSKCPDQLYSILWRCWLDDPNLRPTFYQLVNEMQIIKDTLEKEMVDIDKCSTYVNYTTLLAQNEVQPETNEDNNKPKASTSYL